MDNIKKNTCCVSVLVVMLLLALIYIFWPTGIEREENFKGIGETRTENPRNQDKESNNLTNSLDKKLSVIVKSAFDAAPLLNARVKIEVIKEIGGEGKGLRSCYRRTNSKGVARFPLQGNPGICRIEVGSQGFQSLVSEIKLVKKGDGSFEITLLDAPEGVTVEKLDKKMAVAFSLSRAATLRGRVVDQRRQPCCGVQ